MLQSFRFQFCFSYMGCMEYMVYGDGSPYRLIIRHEASVYERSVFNGSEVEWLRDCVSAIGLAYRYTENIFPLKSEVVAAFNAWRRQEHEIRMAYLRAHPERYGPIDENDPPIVTPILVRGAHYEANAGWVVDTETLQSPGDAQVYPARRESV